MNAPVSNALAQTIPQRVAVENGQAGFPQAPTQADQVQGMAQLAALANPPAAVTPAPTQEELLKLFAANPGLLANPQLMAQANQAAVAANPAPAVTTLTPQEIHMQKVAAEAAKLGKQTSEAAKAADPFSQIASLISGIFGPLVTSIESAIKQFTGIGGDAIQAAVNSGFGSVQAKQLDIRKTLKDLFSKTAGSFVSLSEAAEQGKLDVPTQKLAELVNKAIKEFPQAFDAAMKDFPQAFEAAMKTIPIDEAMMTRVLGKVQEDIGNNQPKLLAALEQLKKQLPSGNLDMNKIEQVFKDMPTRAELN